MRIQERIRRRNNWHNFTSKVSSFFNRRKKKKQMEDTLSYLKSLNPNTNFTFTDKK